MYNENLKIEFIKNYTHSISTAATCESVFDFTEPYELKWGADLCTRSLPEVQPLVNHLIGVRAKSKWTRIMVLKAYAEWCIKTGVPGACDSLLNADMTSLDQVRIKMISNPTHMQRVLDEVFEKEEEETVDNVYRCYYWMAYSGIDKEGILAITRNDVDLSTMSVIYEGRRFPIYRESLSAFKYAMNANTFAYKHPNYSTVIRRDRAPGNVLIRGYISETNSDKISRVLVNYSLKARRNGRTETQLSYYRVWLSGLFYRTYEREKAGYDVDFTEAAIEYMGDKEYKLSSGRNTLEAKKRKVIREYEEDYSRWKLAFSI